jgi:hypothetical protein
MRATLQLQYSYKFSALKILNDEEKNYHDRSPVPEVEIDRNNQSMIAIVAVRPNIDDNFLSQ